MSNCAKCKHQRLSEAHNVGKFLGIFGEGRPSADSYKYSICKSTGDYCSTARIYACGPNDLFEEKDND